MYVFAYHITERSNVKEKYKALLEREYERPTWFSIQGLNLPSSTTAIMPMIFTSHVQVQALPYCL